MLYDDLDIYLYDVSSLGLVISLFFPSYDHLFDFSEFGNGAVKIVINIYIYVMMTLGMVILLGESRKKRINLGDCHPNGLA